MNVFRKIQPTTAQRLSKAMGVAAPQSNVPASGVLLQAESRNKKVFRCKKLPRSVFWILDFFYFQKSSRFQFFENHPIFNRHSMEYVQLICLLIFESFKFSRFFQLRIFFASKKLSCWGFLLLLVPIHSIPVPRVPQL